MLRHLDRSPHSRVLLRVRVQRVWMTPPIMKHNERKVVEPVIVIRAFAVLGTAMIITGFILHFWYGW
jgi:hypothetical protein